MGHIIILSVMLSVMKTILSHVLILPKSIEKTNLSHAPTVNRSYHALLLPKSDMILPNGASSNSTLQIKSVRLLLMSVLLQTSIHIIVLSMPKDFLSHVLAMTKNLSQNTLPRVPIILPRLSPWSAPPPASLGSCWKNTGTSSSKGTTTTLVQFLLDESEAMLALRIVFPLRLCLCCLWWMSTEITPKFALAVGHSHLVVGGHICP